MLYNGYYDEEDEFDELEELAVAPANSQQINGHSSAMTPPEVHSRTNDLYNSYDLQHAASRGNLKLVTTQMEELGMGVDDVLRSGWTVLLYALQGARHVLARELVSRGADVNFHHDMFYPLMACVSQPCLPESDVGQCVELLMGAGALVNVHDRSHVTPLMMASKNGYTKAVRLLCQAGSVDLNKQDDRGWTALMYAASENKSDIVKILMEHGASTFVQSYEALTCSDIAHECGHQKLYEYLERTIHPNNQSLKDPRTVSVFPDESKSGVRTMGSLETFLSSNNLEGLIPLFQEQHVDFPTLLTMNEKDLERMGITQVGLQKRILESVRSLHSSEWEMPDQSAMLYTLELNSKDSAKVFKIYGKHLRYIKATATYLANQLENSRKLEREYQTNQIEESGLMEHFKEVYEVTCSLHDTVSAMAQILTDKLKHNPVADCQREDGMDLARKTCTMMFGIGIGVMATYLFSQYTNRT